MNIISSVWWILICFVMFLLMVVGTAYGVLAPWAGAWSAGCWGMSFGVSLISRLIRR